MCGINHAADSHRARATYKTAHAHEIECKPMFGDSVGEKGRALKLCDVARQWRLVVLLGDPLLRRIRVKRCPKKHVWRDVGEAHRAIRDLGAGRVGLIAQLQLVPWVRA